MKFDIRAVGAFDVISARLADGEVFDSAKLKNTVRFLIENDMRCMVIDLGNLEYLYSDSLSAFIASNRAMVEVSGRIALLSTHPKVQDILRRAGIDNIMKIYKSEAEMAADSLEIMRQLGDGFYPKNGNTTYPSFEIPSSVLPVGVAASSTESNTDSLKQLENTESQKNESIPNALELASKVEKVSGKKGKPGFRKPSKKKLQVFLENHSPGQRVTKAYLLDKIGWGEEEWDMQYSASRLPDLMVQTDTANYKLEVAGPEIDSNAISSAFQFVRPGETYHRVGHVLKGFRFSYKLDAILGQGYFGQVWKATNTSNGRPVALKAFLPKKSLLAKHSLEKLIRRFAREGGNSIAFLKHENIVEYLDFSSHSDPYFSVMEIADESLHDFLDRRTKVNTKDSINIIRDCLKGLCFLHERKFWHRDIKPQNILVKGNRFLLGDLGLMKWKDPSNDFISLERISIDGTFLGTRNYMPTEQEENSSKVDGSADIYALGITWYQLLTGQILLPGRVAAKAFDIPQSSSIISEKLKEMLCFNPIDRPSASELLEYLDGISKLGD